jgi:hypothetical protein
VHQTSNRMMVSVVFHTLMVPPGWLVSWALFAPIMN